MFFKFKSLIGEGAYGLILLVEDLKTRKEQVLKLNVNVDIQSDSNNILNIVEIVNHIYSIHSHTTKINEMFIIDYFYNLFPNESCRNKITNAINNSEIYKLIENDFQIGENKYEERLKFVDKVVLSLELADSDISELANFCDTYQTDKILVDILLALEYIHTNGIAHLDIYSTNILYFEDSVRFKLHDFGHSKNIVTKQNRTVSNICRHDIMPPEVTNSFYKIHKGISDLNFYIPEIVKLDKVDIWQVAKLWESLLIERGSEDYYEIDSPLNHGKLDIMKFLFHNLEKELDQVYLAYNLLYEHVSQKDIETLENYYPELIYTIKTLLKNKEVPKIKIHEPLLVRMLSIDPSKRPSATDCLNDERFIEFKEYIEKIREINPMKERFIYKSEITYPLKPLNTRIFVSALLLFHKFSIAKISQGDEKYIQSINTNKWKIITACACEFIMEKYLDINSRNLNKKTILTYYRRFNLKYRIYKFNKFINFINKREDEIVKTLQWKIFDVEIFDKIIDMGKFVSYFSSKTFDKISQKEFIKMAISDEILS